MSLIRRAGEQLLERRANAAQEFGDSTPPTNGMLGGAVAGTTVSERTALQVAAVYGSVGVIADGLATLPLELHSSTDPATRRKLPPSPLLAQPYAEISRMDWLVQYAMSMALRGNFYGQILEHDQDLYPTQIKPIHPDKARVRRLPNGQVEYRFNGETVPIDQVFHVRYLSVAGSLVGLNPVEYLRNTLGLARAADMHGAAFFQNSAYPGGAIETEEDLDGDETVALARSWNQAHQGIGQAHLPAVLTGGAKFNAISISPRDSQFLESRQFSQGEISGMIFRVPPHMIGIVDRTTSWGTGIAQQEQGFVTNTLGGYLVRLENAFSDVHPPSQYARFDLNQRLRGDKLQRYQAYSLGTLGGWLCADDVRNEEGMPPIPAGEPATPGKTFLMPINSEPVQAALAQALAATTTPPPPSSGGGENQ